MTTRSPLRFLTATAGASLLLASCAVGPKAPEEDSDAEKINSG